MPDFPHPRYTMSVFIEININIKRKEIKIVGHILHAENPYLFVLMIQENISVLFVYWCVLRLYQKA